jgi:riboflavin synthase
MGIQIPSTDGLEIGASVSIDGVCLTATSVDEAVTFDIIPETLERTTLGSLSPGSSVNVERALKFGDELGGHLLSGHIMGTAEILTVENQDYTIKCSSEMAEFIQEKGFIAVDGISLTVGVTDGQGCFDVHIIPETLRLTTLGSKGIGDLVNIEIDAMTQAVVETTKRLMANKEV